MSESTKPKLTTVEYFYGWDMLFGTVSGDIKRPSDYIIALIHFVLTRHHKFRCLGIGEDQTLCLTDPTSELLPSHWNVDDKKYAIRYVREKKLYILFGFLLREELMLNLLDVTTKEISNFHIDPQIYIENDKSSIKEIIPTAMTFCRRMEFYLIKPHETTVAKTEATQTPAERTRFEYRHPTSLFPIRSFSDFGTDPDNDAQTPDMSDGFYITIDG